jgi:ribonuclease D
MSAELITAPAALSDLCRTLAGAEWVAVDTEFLRERTYSARLCLVQIASHDVVAIIDPLALGNDGLAPLVALLDSERPHKVLHAARQDLEVFHDLEQRVPTPVFDTQIAAAYLGYDDQIGYAPLVAALTGVTLDKSHTRTDWSVRPLSAAQLQYAADDVRYLRPVYEALHEQLAQRGRLAWVEEDCQRLTQASLYRNDPAEAWRRLRGGADLVPASQQVLCALAEWRERVAQERNLPRAWVLRDEVLFELARHTPEKAHELASIRGLEDSARRRHGEAILACIATARQAEAIALWPRLLPLTPAQNALAKQLMGHIRELAQQLGMAPAVVATRRDVEKLVRGTDPAQLFHGWRAELVGPSLAAVVSPARDSSASV